MWTMTAEQFYILIAVVAAFAAFSIWAIRDASRREFGSPLEKFIWMQVAVLIPFLGGIIYLLVGRKRGRPIQ